MRGHSQCSARYSKTRPCPTRTRVAIPYPCLGKLHLARLWWGDWKLENWRLEGDRWELENGTMIKNPMGDHPNMKKPATRAVMERGRVLPLALWLAFDCAVDSEIFDMSRGYRYFFQLFIQ